jgi:hypothetical protein
MLAAPAAAYGLHALITAEAAERRRALATVGATGAAIVAAVAILWIARGPNRSLHPDDRIPGPALSLALALATAAVLGALAWARAGRARLALAAAAVALAFVDVSLFERGRAATEPRPDPGGARRLAGLDGIDREWRIYDEFVVRMRAGSRLRVRNFRGYPTRDPFELRRYEDVLELAETAPAILEAFNVRWILWGPHHRNAWITHHLTRRPDEAAPAHASALDKARY